MRIWDGKRMFLSFLPVISECMYLVLLIKINLFLLVDVVVSTVRKPRHDNILEGGTHSQKLAIERRVPQMLYRVWFHKLVNHPLFSASCCYGAYEICSTHVVLIIGSI